MTSISKLSKDLANAEKRRDELKAELEKLQADIVSNEAALGVAVYEGQDSSKAAEAAWKLEKRKQALTLAITRADQVVSGRQLHLAQETKAEAIKELQALDKTCVNHLVGFFKGAYMMQAASETVKEDINKIGEFARGNDLSPDQAQTWKIYEYIADLDEALARLRLLIKNIEATRPDLAEKAQA